ncbi:DUF1989 domain-containing protein [Bacillus taeanensis]|uniref:DUF1989 domain-containing protein n=1 Tax=Bacillus taeanensis TaxID=273032 RepID=A0A366XZ93_9BACI|nr:urea carboxylase-associated family protein [Bacillus taeanensis]RBW69251.1 hypothetical protein DS031_12800 [Bacillus taeanensis]
MKKHFLIPAKTGLSIEVKKGSIIKIIDVEGQQVADFTAYHAEDYHEKLDLRVTIDALNTVYFKLNDALYSNMYRPMFTILKDTVGKHGVLLPACRAEMYEWLYNKNGHRNCYDNLNESLSKFNIPKSDHHYPFNIFMNTVLHQNGTLQVEKPLSTAGDFLKLKVEMDVIIAISACPVEESPCNGYFPSTIELEVEC